MDFFLSRGGQVSGDSYSFLQKDIDALDAKERELDELIKNAGMFSVL